MIEKEPRCMHCDNPIPPRESNKGGPERKYCSKKCGDKAYGKTRQKRKHMQLMQKYKKDFEEYDMHTSMGWKDVRGIADSISFAPAGIRSRIQKLGIAGVHLRSSKTLCRTIFYSPDQIKQILEESSGTHMRDRDGFIARVNLKHNNFYDYSKVKFTPRAVGMTWKGQHTRQLHEYNGEEIVTIICPKHGDYQQRARKHIEGSGCHSCAREAISEALINSKGDACFLSANDFKEFEDHIEIYHAPSDGIQRTILIDKVDREILEFAKWRVTGHQPSRNSRTCYCVCRATNRLIKEGLGWLGTGPKMHRLIMSRVVGRELKRNECIDHIDGNGLDNRRCNLRIATNAQNHANIGKRRGNYSSQYKGVSYSKYMKKWQAYIGSNKKNSIVQRMYLGFYDIEEEAARAYDEKAKEFHGEFAVLNFPDKIPQ